MFNFFKPKMISAVNKHEQTKADLVSKEKLNQIIKEINEAINNEKNKFSIDYIVHATSEEFLVLRKQLRNYYHHKLGYQFDAVTVSKDTFLVTIDWRNV
jgi:hypothetical protein